jgi:hypothetical protein
MEEEHCQVGVEIPMKYIEEKRWDILRGGLGRVFQDFETEKVTNEFVNVLVEEQVSEHDGKDVLSIRFIFKKD